MYLESVCCGMPIYFATLLMLLSAISSFRFSEKDSIYIAYIFYTKRCKIFDNTPIGVIKYEKMKENGRENK